MRILFNPETFVSRLRRNDGTEYDQEVPSADIKDYPISEAVKDASGNIVMDQAMGNYRSTGQTLEFTLLKGQAGEFEDYVADILLDRYEFLEDKTGKVGKVTKASLVGQEEVVKPAGDHRCPYCSKTTKGSVQLGMHIGAAHPDKLGG